MGIWGSQTVVTRFVWCVSFLAWLIVYCIYLIGSWFMTLSSARITTDSLVCKQCNFSENVPSFMYLCNHYPSCVLSFAKWNKYSNNTKSRTSYMKIEDTTVCFKVTVLYNVISFQLFKTREDYSSFQRKIFHLTQFTNKRFAIFHKTKVELTKCESNFTKSISC